MAGRWSPRRLGQHLLFHAAAGESWPGDHRLSRSL